MGGRFGKYGETKRKARIRQSDRLKRKIDKKVKDSRRKRKPN